MKNLFLFTVLILTATSCKKSIETNEQFPLYVVQDIKITEFLEFLNRSNDGGLVLTEFHSNGWGIPSEGAYISSGFFKDANNNYIDGILNINTHAYSFDSQKGYNDNGAENIHCFGDDIDISLLNAINDTVFKIQFYVPNKVAFSENFVENEIEVGSQISWNADSENENGLIISTTYNPKGFGNDSISTYYPYNIENFEYVTEDNGEYIVTNELLQGFPLGGVIDISVVRGSFKLIKIGGVEYGIVVTSESNDSYTIVK